MIEAIRNIGEYALEDDLNLDTFLKGICLRVLEEKNNKKDGKIKQYIVFFNFNTKNKKIDIEIEQVNAGGKDSGIEYLWVDNFKGNKPPINITSNRADNILTKSLPMMRDKINNSELKDLLNKIVDDFFITKEFINKNKKEIFYYLNPDRLNFSNETFSKLKEIENEIQTSNEKKEIKKHIDVFTKEIIKNLLYRINLNSNEVSLYTIKIGNNFVCKMKDYIDLIYKLKVGLLFDEHSDYKDNYQKGICSICNNKNTPTTSNATNLNFKFYMTDKIGFSSNLDGRFKKNYNICKECYQYLMIGENFINSNLNSKIGGLSVYIIPNFFFKIDNLDIEEFSKFIEFSSNSITNINSIAEFRKNLLKFRDLKKNAFIINYLFYYKPTGSNEFKILNLIKDIPPSRLDFIRRVEEELFISVNEYHESDNSFKIDLGQIWSCIPVKREEKGNYSGYSKYLHIIDAIFSNKRIKYNFLIDQFLETLRIIKFEREGYNIWTKQDFVNKVLVFNFLLLFFNKLKILGGINMHSRNKVNTREIEGLIPKDILNYWDSVEIYNNEFKKALFLIGFLVGEIGNAQSGKDIKNKPILNKINFQGMGKEKLYSLTNDILEKLKQYNRLHYDEEIYSAIKLLMDNSIKNYELSIQENVFYILSGYAFLNYLIKKRSKEKYYKKLGEILELIEQKKERGENMEEVEIEINKAKNFAENNKYSEARKHLEKIKLDKNEEDK
ncbi:MAG: TIGR02556 family CRISPR-associated protein [Atribacterota bacterium]|jgi:CRISPR-associated protein Csh1|nr:TIGR02556 family CRISPR-associated protein [Atribacterota bacterium]MDD4897007.1 TIGR02556 family CRISPR-associated protein [Atribacterota bacterium]MDD5636891.1 TIGR02556 family CRISPR-associated protein [Atribacterota bacterium]